MELLSRRKFVKLICATGLLVTAGSLVGCGGAEGGSQIGSSKKDVNGLLVESAEISLLKSDRNITTTCGFFTIKNVTEDDLSLYKENFSSLIGENFNWGKDRANSISVERKQEAHCYDVLGRPFTIKPGESYNFLVEFNINNTQYEILKLNCYIQITFKNGDKAQSFTRKVDTLTVGNVKGV